jgi:hypothetical protein
MRVLASELRRLSEYLIGQAKGRTQFVAIKEVEAAIDAAERSNKEGILAPSRHWASSQGGSWTQGRPSR